MSDEKSEEWRTLPLAMRLSDEELELIRWIGARLSRILLERYEDLPFTERKDELGVLYNMVARVTKELGRAKKRDQEQKDKLRAQARVLAEQKAELELRVIEIEEARAIAAGLLARVRELTAPVLTVHDRVVLVPIAGAIDSELLAQTEDRIVHSISTTRARVVILDITGAKGIDSTFAAGLVRITRTVSLLGAHVILCGVSSGASKSAVQQGLDFSPAIVRKNLSDAIQDVLAAHFARLASKAAQKLASK